MKAMTALKASSDDPAGALDDLGRGLRLGEQVEQREGDDDAAQQLLHPVLRPICGPVRDGLAPGRAAAHTGTDHS